MAEPVWLGDAGDDEAAAGALDDAAGGAIAEAVADGAVVGVDDAAYAEALALFSKTFGAVVGTAACFVDLQPLTNTTEQTAVLSTAM